ncbi:MAG: EF-hand domain-containing protein [Opitutaceae bacterium]
MKKYTPHFIAVSAIAILSGCSETSQSNQSSSTATEASPVGIQSKESSTMIAAVVVEETTSSVDAEVEPVRTVQPRTGPVAVVEQETALLSTPVPTVKYDFPAKAPINLKRQFKDFDSDKDGLLSLTEYGSYMSKWLSRNHPEIDREVWIPRQVSNKDQNGDGKLSPEEVFARYL